MLEKTSQPERSSDQPLVHDGVSEVPQTDAGAEGADTETASNNKAYQYLHTPAPTLESSIESFWSSTVPLESIPEVVTPPHEPYEILKRLGTSPFEASNFPLVGFLASAYERASRLAMERGRATQNTP